MSIVEIRVKGHLDQVWSHWMEGLTITLLEQNQTLITGHLPDQSALFGLIARLRDTGQELIFLRYGDLEFVTSTS